MGLLLAQDNGVTPRYYFETIYSLLTTEGRDGDCVALTQFFQVAITWSTPNLIESVLEVDTLLAPPLNPSLIKHQEELLQNHFPQLILRAAAQQYKFIAVGIGILATQQQTQYNDEAKATKIANTASHVAKWMGDTGIIRILQMLMLVNETDFKAACPIYRAIMAKFTKVSRMGVLGNTIDALLV